jgi:hypothetical protein
MITTFEQRILSVARLLAMALVTVGSLVWLSAPAFAQAGAGWEITGRSYPTNVKPGGTGLIDVQVFNVGAGDSEGTVTVTDTLPPGLEAIEAGDLEDYLKLREAQIGHSLWNCTGTSVVRCVNNPVNMPHIAGGAGGSGGTQNNLVPQIAIRVRALAGASEHERSTLTIAGGGAQAAASSVEPITISSSTPPFGFTDWNVWFSNADGTVDTQAGSHPYAVTFSFDLNNVADVLELGQEKHWQTPGGNVRDIQVKLPPGFVGNPNVVAECTLQQLDDEGDCPPETQIGIEDSTILGEDQNRWPIYNMVPPKGDAAEFAFTLNGINVFLISGVRSGSNYGIVTDADNTPERGVLASTLTLWGVPDDPSHNRWRNASQNGCASEEEGTGSCPTANGDQRPLLTLPASCGDPQPFTIRANTWQNGAFTEPTTVLSHDDNETPTGFTGCEDLTFGPTLSGTPDTSNADTPAGLTVEVKPPVGGLETPEGLSTADVQNTTVTLPEGLVINPGQAAGLEACQPWQDGLTTEAEKAAGEEDNGPPSCPGASKVGTDSIKTPLLEGAAEKELQGNVYVLRSNPPELKLLVAASADGVNVKLVGTVHLNEQTGRLTTTFEGTPALPFTSFKLSFSGGAQAALATPTRCGAYTTTSDFGSSASPFVADVFPTSSFSITQGTGGAACPSSPLPFGPSLTAGSTTDQAGGFTDFSMLLQAPDDQQRIEKLQFKVPSGLLGMISRVPLCGEPQAQDGTCSSASQIGHTTVASGPGPYPLVVPQPGQPPAAIYLTGPYKGAPFGLSIVVPVVVGPFTLQTQIVRAAIEVDPLTSQITVTTDPLPQIIDGVPTDLRTVDAVIDRPGFMFNPTNCSPMSFSGTAWGTPPPGVGGPGSTAAISSHFQMGSCRSLLFKPDFKVSTSGKTSRKNGASLDAKIIYPRGALGANQASSQSNLRSVKVDLPKQLPSRLTTLQKACTSQVFEANPANCPGDSRVGTASALTPVLPVELTGPAYFVSYGGAKFPELVFALQGYGVTIYVHGETFINKAGITSSTFHQVPDVPIYQFELKLPQGPFSALAANGNLCNTKLKMPTAFSAQDGAVIHQTTAIRVTGCTKHKAKAKKKGKGTGARHKSKKK